MENICREPSLNAILLFPIHHWLVMWWCGDGHRKLINSRVRYDDFIIEHRHSGIVTNGSSQISDIQKIKFPKMEKSKQELKIKCDSGTWKIFSYRWSTCPGPTPSSASRPPSSSLGFSLRYSGTVWCYIMVMIWYIMVIEIIPLIHLSISGKPVMGKSVCLMRANK